MSPSDAEAARYQRQLLVPGFSTAALEQLRGARVHVVGAGAAAGPALLYLAQAGVGTLYLDDDADVGAGDDPAWLYRPDQVGQPRILAALEAVRAASALTTVRIHATGSEVTATLVCAQSEGVARTAAERARLAGKPHVVGLATGDGGGEVVVVPYGAPCFSCATRPGARVPARGATAAAIGSLAALELVLLLGRIVPGRPAGRRIELADGRPSAQATTRRPGCDCHNAY
jgi:adenylyltransferase/sulfurtransferase